MTDKTGRAGQSGVRPVLRRDPEARHRRGDRARRRRAWCRKTRARRGAPISSGPSSRRSRPASTRSIRTPSRRSKPSMKYVQVNGGQPRGGFVLMNDDADADDIIAEAIRTKGYDAKSHWVLGQAQRKRNVQDWSKAMKPWAMRTSTCLRGTTTYDRPRSDQRIL